MSSVTIQVRGLPEIRKKLGAVQGQNFTRGLLMVAGKHLKSKFARYPPRKSVTRTQAYGRPFDSDRQRKWFFASLRDGSLSVPHRRTREFGNKWYVKAKDTTAVVGNPAAYGDFVMGPNQARLMMLIGWKKAIDIAEKERRTLERKMQQQIDRKLKS